MGNPLLHVKYALKILNGLAQTNKYIRECNMSFWTFDRVWKRPPHFSAGFCSFHLFGECPAFPAFSFSGWRINPRHSLLQKPTHPLLFSNTFEWKDEHHCMNILSMPQCNFGTSKNIKEQSHDPSSYCRIVFFRSGTTRWNASIISVFNSLPFSCDLQCWSFNH